MLLIAIHFFVIRVIYSILFVLLIGVMSHQVYALSDYTVDSFQKKIEIKDGFIDRPTLPNQFGITTFEEITFVGLQTPKAGLNIIKNVINDDGGTNVPSDFTMIVTATNPSDNNFPGNSTGTIITIDPGSFSISESPPEGYSATFSSACAGFAIAGEFFTCTVTNDDITPTTANLTVIKNVVNDDGGTNVPSDFTMVVTANNPSLNIFAGSSSPGTTITIGPGAYSVDETGPVGYGKILSTECSGIAVVGLSYTCTITNNDEFCVIPGSGDWIITEDCLLATNSSAPADVIVQNNSIITIPIGVTLDIDFENFSLTIKSGSTVLIKLGGIIT